MTLNILIPMAGKSSFFSGSTYPKPLYEIDGVPMIQYALSYLSKIREPKRFIFIVQKDDCVRFHLDNTLKLLTNNQCKIIVQDGDCKGAACSCLLAIDQINNDDPLIISNADQWIDFDVSKALEDFRTHDADGGMITFDSVHPKWSYVKSQNRSVSEVAEKNPISRDAIAGFYYFKKGSSFVRAAQESVFRDAAIGGMYFLAPTYNELVLRGMNRRHVPIDRDSYHNFYSIEKIELFEKRLGAAPRDVSVHVETL